MSFQPIIQDRAVNSTPSANLSSLKEISYEYTGKAFCEFGERLTLEDLAETASTRMDRQALGFLLSRRQRVRELFPNPGIDLPIQPTVNSDTTRILPSQYPVGYWH